MAGIKQVAKAAGVSPATVSRVLNGATSVRPCRREQVLRTVAELGYQRNRVARNLRRRTADIIGVVISDIENPHFAQMVRAVEDAAYGSGFRVLLCNTDENAEKQRAYLDVLAAERVSGIILAPSDPAGPEIARVLDLGIPVVAFDRVVSDPRADAVVVDNVEAGRRATQHLLGAGHTRVGFVGGRADIQTGAERLAGYRGAIQAAGAEAFEAEGGFRLDQARVAADALLRAYPDLTALVVANNLMTLGVLRAVHASGRRMPDEIALVAIDDPFWAELVEPQLTTLAQPVRRMVEVTVRLLLERIRGERVAPTRMVFDVELCVRRSCGTVRVG